MVHIGVVALWLAVLLIGLDGSASSTATASLAVRLFGPRVRKVTLATLLDADTAAPHAENLLHPERWPGDEAAREQLTSAATALEVEMGGKPGSVILAEYAAAGPGTMGTADGT